MVITKVVKLVLREIEQVVTATFLPNAVLATKIEEERNAEEECQPDQSKADAVAGMIDWCLAVEKDVARDEASCVAETDLHGGRDGFLVVSTHVVVEPGHDDGLSDVTSRHDSVDAEVTSSDGDLALRSEEDPIPDCGDQAAQDGEGETVANAVGDHSGDTSGDSCNDVDGNRHDLCSNRGPTQLVEDSWSEERRGIARVDNSEVHEHTIKRKRMGSQKLCPIAWFVNEEASLPNIDLHVGERTLGRSLVETVHFDVASVDSQTSQKEASLLFTKERCGLGPIHNHELGRNSHNHGKETFDDEDPTPAVVTTNASHVRDGIRQELETSKRLATPVMSSG